MHQFTEKGPNIYGQADLLIYFKILRLHIAMTGKMQEVNRRNLQGSLAFYIFPRQLILMNNAKTALVGGKSGFGSDINRQSFIEQLFIHLAVHLNKLNLPQIDPGNKPTIFFRRRFSHAGFKRPGCHMNFPVMCLCSIPGGARRNTAWIPPTRTSCRRVDKAAPAVPELRM